jgi:hypothetical protein
MTSVLPSLEASAQLAASKHGSSWNASRPVIVLHANPAAAATPIALAATLTRPILFFRIRCSRCLERSAQSRAP